MQAGTQDQGLLTFAAILRLLGKPADTTRPKHPLTLVTAILAGSICALSSVSVLAASLERLSDGRIVLTALGEKFAFREKDADHVELYWPQYPCQPRPARADGLG